MKKIFGKVLYVIIFLVIAVIIGGWVLAFVPTKSKSQHTSITPEEAIVLRERISSTHHQFKTSDGVTLFLRTWTPDSSDESKNDLAILILHGITAHSGAYDMAGNPISKGGFTTFGLDYRGHGLSDGNRADYSGKERWIADLTESVHYIKDLGFSKVIVLGHSLGVASAIYLTKNIPDEITGLILLSGAYEGKKGVREDPTYFETAKILARSVFRPSVQSVHYFREGMTGLDDPLFNFSYTLRFLTMMDVKELILPADLNIPVLVATGDKDELFDVDKVRELYDKVPGDKKTFLVLKDTYHAKFPDESWDEVVAWLHRNF